MVPAKNTNRQTPDNFYKYNVLTLRFSPQKLWMDLANEHQQEILEQHYIISAQSSRMGYRLSQLPKSALAQVVNRKTLSKPVTYGTIQLPENGEPIILMKERQTIGGYPVMGSVMQTDLFRLSQLRPGEKVKLQPTTLIDAQQQLNMFYRRFK
jgi:allophanate hydrolase subunit 2